MAINIFHFVRTYSHNIMFLFALSFCCWSIAFSLIGHGFHQGISICNQRAAAAGHWIGGKQARWFINATSANEAPSISTRRIYVQIIPGYLKRPAFQRSTLFFGKHSFAGHAPRQSDNPVGRRVDIISRCIRSIFISDYAPHSDHG